MVVYETQDIKTNWKITQKKKMLTSSCVLITKKCHFPRFPSFRFCPIPKIENAEILESFLLLKILVVYETQNLKTGWKITQNKKRYYCDVIWEGKMPIFVVSEFSILPYTWNQKRGNLEKFSFTLNFYHLHYIKHGKG